MKRMERRIRPLRRRLQARVLSYLGRYEEAAAQLARTADRFFEEDEIRRPLSYGKDST